MSDWGLFPFGKPNAPLPARVVTDSDAVVVLDYPDAWHVEWSAPPHLVAPGSRGGIGALPVDVDPYFSLAATGGDFGERLARWKAEVGFQDGKHGTVSEREPPANRALSARIVRCYLEPLGLDPARVTLITVVPAYCVPRERNRFDAGNLIEAEYNALADALAVVESSLPVRQASSKLAGPAARAFGERLLVQLAAARAPLVITLGHEAFETLSLLSPLQPRPPRKQFLTPMNAGDSPKRGSLLVGGREVAWLPLAHPAKLEVCEKIPPPRRPRSPAGAPRPPPPPLAPECEALALTLVRARFVNLRKLGPTLEVLFAVGEGPHQGSVARGRFPIAKRGLLVLTAAALFEPLRNYATLADRLVGARVVADVVHGGTNGHSLALVRNVQPSARGRVPSGETLSRFDAK